MTYFPQPVEDTLDIAVPRLLGMQQSLGLALDGDILRQVLGELLFDKWLVGSEADVTVEELQSVLTMARVRAEVLRLQEEGLVHVFDDGTGEEIVVLTEKGRQEAQKVHLPIEQLN